MNCGVGSPPLSAMEHAFLTLSTRVFPSDVPSFTGFGAGLGPVQGPPEQRIDHVLLSGFAADAVEVVVRARGDGSERRVSDHRPVIALLHMTV